MSRLSFCAIVLAACTTSGPEKDQGMPEPGAPETPVMPDPTGTMPPVRGLAAFFPSLADGQQPTNAAFVETASVYLDASPTAMVGGDYYFHVVDPADMTSALSSDDVACRRIHIDDTGMIDDVYASACAHVTNALAGGLTVQLEPYAPTSSIVTADDGTQTQSFLLELTPVASYDGTLPADAVTRPFSIVVPASLCGNGVIDAGEQCDDGSANGTAGDACSSTCQCVPS
jgi:cysteine-rich repeat protein